MIRQSALKILQIMFANLLMQGCSNTMPLVTGASGAPVLSYIGSGGTTGKVGQWMTIAPAVLSSPTTVSACQAAGGLPAGLSINAATCVVSGTPTVAVSGATYLIVASNSSGVSVPAAIILTISGTVPTLSFAAINTTGIVGVPISFAPTLNTGGLPITGCSVVSGFLPLSLSLDPLTCTVSGVLLDYFGPTVYVPNSSVGIVAKNAAGSSASATLNMFVTYSNQLGRYDVSQKGTFVRPAGIAIDSSGFIYVTDLVSNSVQKFDSHGHWVLTFDSSGQAAVDSPIGVAVSPAGYIFVVDNKNARIVEYNSLGQFVSAFGNFSTIAAAGTFSSPVGIYIDPSGNIFVSDVGRVQKFDSSFNYMTQFGTAGTGNGQFGTTDLLTGDASGNIYVADPVNHRVEIFAGGTYTYLNQYTVPGNFEPYGVALLQSGAIAATDQSAFEVQISSGTPSSFGTAGAGANTFNSPAGIAVDSAGYIYVVDGGNSRVLKFDSSGNPVAF